MSEKETARAKIKLSKKYEIWVYPRYYALGEVRRSKNKNKVVERMTNPAYYPTLQSLIKCAPEKMLRETTAANNMGALVEELKGFTTEIEMAVCAKQGASG